VVEFGKEGGPVIATESSIIRGGERVAATPAPATTSDSRGGKGGGARTMGRGSRAGGRQPPASGLGAKQRGGGGVTSIPTASCGRA